MARKTRSVPKELIQAISSDAIETLSDIEQLCVSEHVGDASTAIRAGAVLLGISRVDNDEDGSGFRILIGLRKGTRVTPYLGNFFKE